MEEAQGNADRQAQANRNSKFLSEKRWRYFLRLPLWSLYDACLLLSGIDPGEELPDPINVLEIPWKYEANAWWPHFARCGLTRYQPGFHDERGNWQDGYYENTSYPPTAWLDAFALMDDVELPYPNSEGSEQPIECESQLACSYETELLGSQSEKGGSIGIRRADTDVTSAKVDKENVVPKRREMNRADLLRLEIDAALEVLAKEGRKGTAREVMAFLQDQVGRFGSCIIDAGPNFVIWEKADGSPSKLTMKALQQRLDRLNNPS